MIFMKSDGNPSLLITSISSFWFATGLLVFVENGNVGRVLDWPMKGFDYLAIHGQRCRGFGDMQGFYFSFVMYSKL